MQTAYRNNHADCNDKIASVNINEYLSLYMRTFIKFIIPDTNKNINIDDISNESRMELDSHVNMHVVG